MWSIKVCGNWIWTHCEQHHRMHSRYSTATLRSLLHDEVVMMRKWFIALLIILGMSSCLVTENTILKSSMSPDGRFVAMAFLRSAGVTTSYSPQVSILKANKKLPNKPGNIFIGNHSQYINIVWTDTNTLVIVYDCIDKDVIKMIEEFDDIKIMYQREGEG